ncbi:MAG: hypothetical protein SNJ75_17745 [Gemmataceae bacterium]
MQTLNFQCGHCGNLMAVGLEYLGQQVRCPHCTGIVIAPREVASPTGIQTHPPLLRTRDPHDAEDIFSEAPPPSDSLFDEQLSPPEPMSPPPDYEPPSYSSPQYTSPEYTPPSVSPYEEPYSAPSQLADWESEPSPPAAATPPLVDRSTQAPPPADYPVEASLGSAPSEIEPSSNAEMYNGKASTALPGQTPAASIESSIESAASNPQANWWEAGVAAQPAPATGSAATKESLTESVRQLPMVEQPFTPEPTPRSRTSKSGGGMGLLFPLFVMPLILYAIGMTIAAGFLYLRLTSIPPNANPFEQMPDVDGDDPGVKLNKKLTLRFGKQDALAPLPEQQIIGLNETLRIGDLEVTPLQVERRVVRIFDERQGKDGEPEPLPTAPLVLTLRLKNCAEDYSFTPMDNYFDRHWNGRTGSTPLTILQAGTLQFFGGPAKWAPLQRDGKRREFREWLEGRKNGDPIGLKPGESTTTFVCTDGADEATVKHLFGESLDGRKVGKPYQGNLLWRVQLRRGLIQLGGKRYPATCVIGVRFTSRDYLPG